MLRRFAHAGRPGAYLRIVQEGELGAGDEVEIVRRPDHGITIATVAGAIVSDDGALAIAATAPALPPSLAAWMRQRAGVTGSGM
jgi:MOSC domain-containing protein YiiM